MRESHVDDVRCPSLGEKAASASLLHRVNIFRIDLMLGEDVEREVPVFFRHHVYRFFGSGVVGYGDTRWCDQIDSVRHAIDVFVNPIKFTLKCLRRIACSTKNTHTASF